MKHGAPRGTLTTEAVEALVDAAARRARALGVRVHIAVYDASAELAGWLSFEGAPRVAAATARHKAFTAVQTGMPTADWKAYVASIPKEERRIIDRMDGLIAAAGGVPVLEGGVLLGAVGVSGADQAADEDIARAAVAALAT